MTVQLHYLDEAIGAICNDPAASGIGGLLASALHRQLADLDAAESLADLGFTGLDLSAMTAERIVFELAEDVSLIARIDHVQVRRANDESVRWDRSHRIQIMKIEYSGGQR